MKKLSLFARISSIERKAVSRKTIIIVGEIIDDEAMTMKTLTTTKSDPHHIIKLISQIKRILWFS